MCTWEVSNVCRSLCPLPRSFAAFRDTDASVAKSPMARANPELHCQQCAPWEQEAGKTAKSALPWGRPGS